MSCGGTTRAGGGSRRCPGGEAGGGAAARRPASRRQRGRGRRQRGAQRRQTRPRAARPRRLPASARSRRVSPSRLAHLRALLAAAPEAAAPAPTTFSLRAPGAAGHVAAVAECVERIAAGEILQANLCLRLDATYAGDVAELYAHAAPQLQPAYGACFMTPWGGVASLSPELFLRRRGRTVTTGPIKGTAPSDPDKLRAAQADRAELAPGQGDAALLRATFPPGSVTGAPKVQALHVISELEATGREVYTGAIGFASPHAGLELNVAIRTFEQHGNHLWLGAGGGIVADSDPQLELEECLVKARPLIAAIGGTLDHPKGGLTPLREVECWRVKGSDPLIRPDSDFGVFETLLVAGGTAVNLQAHLARLERSVRALYGEELPRIDVPTDRDGAIRIDYVPGEAPTTTWRELKPRKLPIVVTPYVLPGGLGEHKWRDRKLLDALSKDGTTPLILDADGAVLEAAWAAVLIKRDGILYTPRNDGRILPSTSRPTDAEERDLWLQPGDELLLSSSLAGTVPAVLAATNPAPPPGTRRTPDRTAA